MKENFVGFKNVVKSFKTGAAEIRALDGLTFGIEEGEFAVVAGPSGAGKTTLLNLLGGMDAPTGGEIVVDGRNIGAFNGKQLTEYRRNNVGFVFQFYNLMPNLTALENIELAVEICKEARPPKEILKSVGLENRERNFPSQLSGGEQQRVSIARAVAKAPKLLLCDEPTGALDYETGKKILRLLHDICKQEHKTVVVVTHNGALKEMADKVIFIKNGKAERIETNPNPKSIEEIEW
ncbi:ABC transporter ATP-binding protein [Clostridia bacterium]|nr:ABC transporter ATP-binding protein [Clostridia bacterium]